MNSDYPDHPDPSTDIGKEVETLNKFIWVDGVTQSEHLNIKNNPEKKITGILNKEPWGSPNFFHVGKLGPNSSTARIIGKPFRYKILEGQGGGRKSRKNMRRNRNKLRRSTRRN